MPQDLTEAREERGTWLEPTSLKAGGDAGVGPGEPGAGL